MGNFNIGVNSVGSSGYAHAFVEIVAGGPHSSGPSLTQQVHGEPIGGAASCRVGFNPPSFSNRKTPRHRQSPPRLPPTA